jgi:transcriptional regulator GlxA family with amidase domain
MAATGKDLHMHDGYFYPGTVMPVAAATPPSTAPASAFCDAAALVAPRQGRRFDFLAQDASCLPVIAICIDMLRAANAIVDDNAWYDWSVHRDTADLRLSPGLRDRQTLVMIGSIDAPWSIDGTERAALAAAWHQAGRVVLAGGAVFLPQQLRLRCDTKMAIHPNLAASAGESHLPCSGAGNTHQSGDSLSSAISGLAALQLLRDLIGQDHGDYTARATAGYLGLSTGTERGPASRFLSKVLRQSRGDALIASAMGAMAEHIDSPVPVGTLAQASGVSARQLERRFRDKLSTTPSTVYRGLRLEHAHQLIRQTNMSIVEICVASGFATLSNFSRWYRHQYGQTPSQSRSAAFGRQPS